MPLALKKIGQLGIGFPGGNPNGNTDAKVLSVLTTVSGNMVISTPNSFQLAFPSLATVDGDLLVTAASITSNFEDLVTVGGIISIHGANPFTAPFGLISVTRLNLSETTFARSNFPGRQTRFETTLPAPCSRHPKIPPGLRTGAPGQFSIPSPR